MLFPNNKQTNKKSYLLIQSLKETISCVSSYQLEPYIKDVWKVMFWHAENCEEGCIITFRFSHFY